MQQQSPENKIVEPETIQNSFDGNQNSSNRKSLNLFLNNKILEAIAVKQAAQQSEFD